MDAPAIAARHLAALGLAEEASALALSYFGDRSKLDVSMKGAQDWLTAADGAVERLIRARVDEAFPADVVMGEEQGAGGDVSSAEYLWIVDPIDGTANFARSHPHWCVSIGCLHRGVPTIGVIAAPAMGVTWSARRGHGATRNGETIRVSSIETLARASIEIGWSPRLEIGDYLGFLRAVMAAGASPKRCGSGALGMAFVADGRSDGYVEAHINSWDVAAGIVIVAEAGGVTNDFFAGEGVAEGGAILAAPPQLAAELARLAGVQL